MEFKVDIKPENVNDAIVKAVLESSIGDIVKKSIEENVKSLTTRGYGNPIEKVIKDVILEVVKEEVLKRRDNIRKIISENLTDKMVKASIEKFDKFLENEYF